MKRVLVAILCVAAMLAESFSPLAGSVGTAYATGVYTELTLEDFGFNPGVQSGDPRGTVEGLTSLDGVAISGRVKFGTGWLCVGKGNTGDWDGIQLFYQNNGLYVGCVLFGADGKTHNFYTSTNFISNEEANVDFQKDIITLRLAFDYTLEGVDMGVSVNGNFIKTISATEDKEGLGYNAKDYFGTYVMGAGSGLTYMEDYTELTLKDLGIYPGTVASDTIGTSDDITSLDGVAVSGQVKFGSSWLMMGHESAESSEWTGIQMYATNTGLAVSATLDAEEPLKQIAVTSTTGGTSSVTDEGYVRVDFGGTNGWGQVNISEIAAASEIHIFMKNDSEYSRIVSNNWKAASKVLDENGADITASIVSGDNTVLPANSGWLEVVYPYTSTTELNCYSVGSTTSVGSLYIKGYYVDTRMKQYGFTPSAASITNEEAGVNFANDTVDLRYTFDYTDTGVDMGVYVNGKFVKTISFGDSTDGTKNIKELLGKCVMATGGLDYIGNYRELTLADFGIGTGTLTKDTIGTNDSITSLDGVAVSGQVKFGSSWLMMGHESAESSKWTGIQMYANDTGLVVSATLDAEEPLEQIAVTTTTDSTFSVTNDGSVRVDFSENSTWDEVNFSGVAATNEIHIFMKNDSDYKRGVQLNWTKASKVLDENGVDITDSVVGSDDVTKLPANSGWLEVVYPVTTANQLNCISYEENGTTPKKSVGSLYIKSYYVDTREVKQYTFTPSPASITGEEAGVDFANDIVDLRYTFDYTASGMNMAVYVDDTYIKTISFGDDTTGAYKIKDCLGKYIMATTNLTYVEELPEEDAESILEEGGYTRVTVPDFGAMGYKTYTSQNGHSKSDYNWADTLDKTYLDVNVSLNVSSTDDGYIRYGSSDGWNGINISGDGTSLVVGFASLPMTTILPQNVGLKSFENVNVKIALDCGAYTETTDSNSNTYQIADYTLSMWVNNRRVIDGATMKDQPYAGTTLAVYVGNSDASITFDMEYTDEDRAAVSYNLDDGGYLVTGNAKVVKDGAEISLTDQTITAPGDYEVITDVSEKRIRYHKKVALYRLGDVDLNGTAAEQSDLTALEKLYANADGKADSAAEKAADLDNDGTVDLDDKQLMEQILAADDPAAELEKVLDKYYVAAKTYDYLGGNDVMPIVGYFGPYNNSGYDFLTDQYFQAVKDAGINLVNYSQNSAAGETEIGSVMKALNMADKYGLGYFLNDSTLNNGVKSQDGQMTDAGDYEALSTADLAAKLARYDYYDSFLGIHITDEPVYKDSALYAQGGDYLVKELSNYTKVSEQLNSFSNLTGFINLAPESSAYVLGKDRWFGLVSGEDYFNAYIDQYVADGKPQVLSMDDYPFNDKEDEGVTNAGGYFRSLSRLRAESVENDLPFWWYVQAGGNFKDVSASDYAYTAGCVATEEETYWNVNTALAFGAKGIEWFTLIQPWYFHNETLDSAGTDVNGLIDADGDKTEFYDYATEINNHIKNVDEVLMKAESIGVITTGGYAASEIKEGADANTSEDSSFASPIISASDTSRLESVSASDTTYGAIAGCFDYRDTEAYYVMNYNVTEGTSQTVTLRFDGDYNYRLMQQGKEVVSKVGNLCELTIPAGEAVLVVLDSLDESDLICSTVKSFSLTGLDEAAIITGTTINNEKVETTLSNAASFTTWGEYTITYVISGNKYLRKLTMYLPGDADYNGVNNVKDLVVMKKAAQGLTTLEGMRKTSGDLDGNDAINNEDAKALRKILVGNK